jgi:hypothetical protein
MTFSPEQVGRMTNDPDAIDHQALENLEESLKIFLIL